MPMKSPALLFLLGLASAAHATPKASTAHPDPETFHLPFDSEAFLAETDARPLLRSHPEPAYHLQAEVYRELAELSRRWPGRVRVAELGLSVRDRSIWCFAIGDPAHEPTHRMLVIAGLHPMEWIGVEISLSFARAFAESPVPGVELLLVPIANPDGRAMMERAMLRRARLLEDPSPEAEAPLLGPRGKDPSKERYFRGNARGVDLNRDFAWNRSSEALWKRVVPGFYGTSPEPLSQPESRALDRLARVVHIDLLISLHSFGGFIYTPWAGSWSRPADWPRLHALGQAMASGQGAHAYQVKQLSRWAFFFRALGTEIDHFYGEHGIPSFLVETTRTGIEPLDPSSWRSPFRRYNPREPARHVREGLRLLQAGAWALVDHQDELHRER